MARSKKTPAEQIGFLDAQVKTAPCVPAIRQEVAEWRKNGYKGMTETQHVAKLLVSYRPPPAQWETIPFTMIHNERQWKP